jgi:hypothetical protein
MDVPTGPTGEIEEEARARERAPFVSTHYHLAAARSYKARTRM